MNIRYLMFFLLLLISFFGKTQVGLNEPAHIFYQGDEILVKSIVEGKLKADKLNRKSKGTIKVEVEFPSHKDWNFTVNLKPILKDEPSEFKTKSNLFVISDIEGEFEAFRKLLVVNGIMDEKYNWMFGKGHLVICGDLFDRGVQVTQELWLLYKLEQDAKAKGGYVHTILGNHDIMNISGDLRYVDDRYFQVAKLFGVDYMALYSKETELGQWLRTKNTIEKIGDNLCLHAGVSPQISWLNMSLKDINDKSRPYYDKAKDMNGVGDVSMNKFFDSNTSLFWYRGYFKAPKIAEEDIDQTLALYGVRRIIVGHTIVPENLGFSYNGKVLGIDVNQHEGDHQAALFEDGIWYKVNDKGFKIELK